MDANPVKSMRCMRGMGEMRTHFALVKANTVDTIPIAVSANDRDTMIHQSNCERLRVYTRWAKNIWMGPAALEGVSH